MCFHQSRKIPSCLIEIAKRKHAIATSIMFRGIPKSKEHNQKNSESCLGRIPWNKGKTGVQKYSQPWNKGLKTGPMSEEIKRNMSLSRKGKFWWNDGTKEIKAKTCPGKTFRKGRLPGHVSHLIRQLWRTE